MILPPRNILSLVIVGDDLHAARVAVGPIGARTVRAVTIERFLLPTGEARDPAALRAIAGRARRVLLTVPGSWCASRPIGLTTRDWRGARDELRRSIDRFVPFTPDDALAGIVTMHDDAGAPAGGLLVAASRGRVEPWRRAVEAALGVPVGAVMCPMIASLGLGLQRARRAAVLEPVGFRAMHRHELALGLPVRAAQPADDADITAADAVLPGDAASTVTGCELASAAAAASLVAPGVFAPLDGRVTTHRGDWIAPAAAVAAALALFISAPAVEEARVRAAIESLAQERESLAEPFARVRDVRKQAERLSALLGRDIAAATAGWSSVLPILAETQAAVPEAGFLYRIEIDGRGVTISGEAPDTPTILERLESSDHLTAARRAGPLSPSAEPGLDVFEMRADREGGR